MSVTSILDKIGHFVMELRRTIDYGDNLFFFRDPECRYLASASKVSVSKLWHSGSKRSGINSLVLGRFQFNLRYVIFKLNLVNGG